MKDVLMKKFLELRYFTLHNKIHATAHAAQTTDDCCCLEF